MAHKGYVMWKTPSPTEEDGNDNEAFEDVAPINVPVYSNYGIHPNVRLY